MNRRNFALRAASGAVCVMGGKAMAATALPGAWMKNPAAHIGQSYTLPDGAVLTLDRVEAVNADPRLSQWQLHFAGSAPLVEGIHDLKCSIKGEVTPLFLQSRGTDAWACISRLA